MAALHFTTIPCEPTTANRHIEGRFCFGEIRLCSVLTTLCMLDLKFFSVSWGTYRLAKESGNFGLKSNGKVIFLKFRSEIVEYLQRYSSFPIRNRTAENSLPFNESSVSRSFPARVGRNA